MGKVLAIQAWGPEFDPYYPCKAQPKWHTSVPTVLGEREVRDTRIPRAHWPASLAQHMRLHPHPCQAQVYLGYIRLCLKTAKELNPKKWAPGSRKDTVSKQKQTKTRWGSSEGEQLGETPNMHTHRSTHAHMWTHINTHVGEGVHSWPQVTR